MNDRDIEDTRQPPNELEAKFCDECGEEMEQNVDGKEIWDECVNLFCPSMFDEPIIKEMAELFVEQKEEISKLKLEIKYLNRKIAKLLMGTGKGGIIPF